MRKRDHCGRRSRAQARADACTERLSFAVALEKADGTVPDGTDSALPSILAFVVAHVLGPFLGD